MRKALHQYFQPSEADLNDAWERGVIAYDASVLLNIYGYSDETREGLVALIEKRAASVRQPHQFALEYARQRSTTILKQVGHYQNARKGLEDVKATILGKNNHPFLSETCLKHYDEILAELRTRERAMERLVGADPYAERLLATFEGRVSAQPSQEELTKLHAEAQQRYDSGIPPGYEDVREKPGVEAYGDYIGWRQLMDIASESKKHLILVVDDTKADWWQRHGKSKDRIIGPEPRLREEFFHTTGQHVFLYTSENYLRTASARQVATISQNIIQEVAASLEVQREASTQSEEKQELARASSTDKAEAVPPSSRLTKDDTDAQPKSSPDLTKDG
jgi:hypothetical protein